MTELYSRGFDSDVYCSLTLSELTKEYLYFTETEITEVDVGEGKTKDSYREVLMRIDLETHAAEEIAEFDKPFYVHYMDDEYMYFMDQDSKRIYRTDHMLGSEETVFDFSGMFENIAEYSIYGLTYDAESNSLWFGICTNYLSGLSTAMPIEEGHVYRVDIDTFEWERVKMPSEKVMDFTLEGEYIYYTQYDPVSFGAGRVGNCVDETGNKIYRVPRDNTTAEPETVFDGHDKFFVADYFVMGDYIYLEYMQLVRGADLSYFQNTGMTARVNFKENTIKWLDLD